MSEARSRGRRIREIADVEEMPDLAVLSAMLQHRATGVRELAELTARDEQQTRAELGRLERLGLVKVADDAITYRRPELTVAEAIRLTMERTTQALTETAAQSQQLLRALPGLLETWNAVDGTEHSLKVTILEGEWALADMWRLLSARTVPRAAYICLPDTELLRDAELVYEETFWAARATGDADIRVLLSIRDTLRPLNVVRINDELEAGTRIRMHPDPPSHFWITDYDTVTLPMTWGDPRPSTVMSVHSPAIATVLRWVFDQLWSEARPVLDEERPWEPMLQLMSTGLTVEAAARSLGLTARTGRRRVEAAMRHFDVTGQFALGAAWRDSRPG